MALNLLIKFRSGHKRVLLNVNYSKIQPQLDDKSRKGIIIDTIILPDNFIECQKILGKDDLTI